MQNLKKINFAAAAFVLGIGLALSTSSFKTMNDPNVYNTNTSNPNAPNWQPIPDGRSVSCDDHTNFECEGYKASPTAPVTDIQYGEASLL